MVSRYSSPDIRDTPVLCISISTRIRCHVWRVVPDPREYFLLISTPKAEAYSLRTKLRVRDARDVSGFAITQLKYVSISVVDLPLLISTVVVSCCCVDVYGT